MRYLECIVIRVVHLFQGMQLQGMPPEIPQGPHMPPLPPPHTLPSSMSLSRQMPPPGMGMMGTNNPYGPSGPLPPSMGGHMMPPAVRQMGMSSVGQKSQNPLNNYQLQQLSAQIKAYRMLSRSITPPEALISIVQGRKPTAAMLGSLSRGNPAVQQAGMGYQLSGGVPSPAGSSQSAASGSVTGRESPAQTNISLYPLSPSTAGQGPSDGSMSQLKPTSHLMQSHSSAPSPAPNVTLQPGGELPPQVACVRSSPVDQANHNTCTLIVHVAFPSCTCVPSLLSCLGGLVDRTPAR